VVAVEPHRLFRAFEQRALRSTHPQGTAILRFCIMAGRNKFMDRRTWYIIIVVIIVILLAWIFWPRTATTPVTPEATTPPATTTTP
jgi:hypothetical protein